ncbi:1-phosphofructokinase family hexose kinase [Microbacterium sp. RD1]|uniref:1-phosphofructokinase family hexose kinase n=1 Tax=Microbacterium sp. RD1 TaxID=3457313 RepID=UPI003FA56D5F
MARIVTLTPNPAVDITYTVDRQVLGETVRVRDVQRRPGGKGINVARVARALGRDVTTVHPLGGDSGRWIERALHADGIPARYCAIAGETRSTVAVVDGISHPTMLSEPGPALTDAEWEALLTMVAGCSGPGDWVVVAGSFSPGTDGLRLDRLISAVRRRGARVLVDTSGPLLRTAADAGADVVKANENEVQDVVGSGDTSHALARLGGAGSRVVMSRGAQGLLLREPDGAVFERTAVPDVAGNPTGAGDAATAGLVAALTDGHDVDTALAWAAVLGAAAVLHPVAGEIDAARIPDLCARIGLPPAMSPLPTHPERTSP